MCKLQVVIQLNDIYSVFVIFEFMRILVDVEKVDWDKVSIEDKGMGYGVLQIWVYEVIVFF